MAERNAFPRRHPGDPARLAEGATGKATGTKERRAGIGSPLAPCGRGAGGEGQDRHYSLYPCPKCGASD